LWLGGVGVSGVACGVVSGGVVGGAGLRLRLGLRRGLRVGRGLRLTVGRVVGLVMLRRGGRIAARSFLLDGLGWCTGGRGVHGPSVPVGLASYRSPTGQARPPLGDGCWRRCSGARVQNSAVMQWTRRGRNPTEGQIARRTWGPEMLVACTVLPSDFGCRCVAWGCGKSGCGKGC
jgi:hypothetical protein